MRRCSASNKHPSSKHAPLVSLSGYHPQASILYTRLNWPDIFTHRHTTTVLTLYTVVRTASALKIFSSRCHPKRRTAAFPSWNTAKAGSSISPTLIKTHYLQSSLAAPLRPPRSKPLVPHPRLLRVPVAHGKRLRFRRVDDRVGY